MNKKLRKILNSAAAVLFWLIAWEIIAVIIDKEILLPTPIKVIQRLFGLFAETEFYLSVFSSLLRITSGYLIGIIVGCILAYAAFFSKTIKTLLSPMLTVIRATPVASFIILALFWMGKSLVPVFTSFLMVLPIIFSSIFRGLESTDKNLSEVADVFNFGFFRRLKLLYIPSSVPSFVSGAKTSLGLSWKAGIAAEVLCSLKHSIGGNVYSAKTYLESVDLMAWTLTVIIISLLLEALISASLSAFIQKYTVSEVNEIVSRNQ